MQVLFTSINDTKKNEKEWKKQHQIDTYATKWQWIEIIYSAIEYFVRFHLISHSKKKSITVVQAHVCSSGLWWKV